MEVVGEVVRAGAGSEHWLGRRVVATAAGAFGAHAQQVLADADMTFDAPGSLDDVAGGGVLLPVPRRASRAGRARPPPARADAARAFRSRGSRLGRDPTRRRARRARDRDRGKRREARRVPRARSRPRGQLPNRRRRGRGARRDRGPRRRRGVRPRRWRHLGSHVPLRRAWCALRARRLLRRHRGGRHRHRSATDPLRELRPLRCDALVPQRSLLRRSAPRASTCSPAPTASGCTRTSSTCSMREASAPSSAALHRGPTCRPSWLASRAGKPSVERSSIGVADPADDGPTPSEYRSRKHRDERGSP